MKVRFIQETKVSGRVIYYTETFVDGMWTYATDSLSSDKDEAHHKYCFIRDNKSLNPKVAVLEESES